MSSLPRGLTVRRDAGLYGYERALHRHGVDLVAGVDEAGRGACAGPLVAGAAILPPGKARIIPGLADSKLLTEREHDVALAVGQGLTNAEIAGQLHLSVPTVKAHIGRLFTKLGCDNRVQIAICVHDAGLS